LATHPLPGVPIALARWGGLWAGAQRRMVAVDFLASRGMAKGQGKKVAPSAIAAQAIEAQPSFGQIKPWRGRVVRVPNSILGRRRVGRRLPRTRGPAFQAKKRKRWRTERTLQGSDQAVQTPALPRERLSVGLEALASLSAARTALPPATWTSPQRTDSQPIDDEAQAYPSLVAAASVNDSGRPSTRRSTWGGTNSFIRAQAAWPTRTAPMTAKASRQASDGAPICASPSVAW
jgi:hypothetical protein